MTASITPAIDLYETTGHNATAWARLLYDGERTTGGPDKVPAELVPIIHAAFPLAEYRRAGW